MSAKFTTSFRHGTERAERAIKELEEDLGVCLFAELTVDGGFTQI